MKRYVGYNVSVLFLEGDGLTKHQHAFSAFDQDNDRSGKGDCAEIFKGGWWYDKCKTLQSNLNGVYSNTTDVEEYQGIQWNTWKGTTVSFKTCEMKIRRNRFVG